MAENNEVKIGRLPQIKGTAARLGTYLGIGAAYVGSGVALANERYFVGSILGVAGFVGHAVTIDMLRIDEIDELPAGQQGSDTVE
ncbi:hypothetical protein A3D14_01080 [Candidatus Saccharibacteria bacterium RIFCSPHIGHO2_02_FULL_47_12]|nr:MAG: hypothetical protein A3D14_01080 [Candidatus Saccharibacteria bacterium RIFCSPHIGHO2_02_FULL_47_12]